MATTKRAELERAVLRTRATRREVIRRAVMEDTDAERAIALLATQVLGLECRPFHRAMVRHQELHRENLNLAPRGYGKSTINTVLRSVYEILRNPDIRILIASNTATQAEVFLRGVKQRLTDPELVAIFGAQEGKEKWSDREIIVAGRTARFPEATVTTVGVAGPVASRHYDLILGDDMVVEKNARTEMQRETTKTWYMKTLYPTVVDERSRVFLSGTRYHPMDLYGTLIREDPDVAVHIVLAIAKDGTTPWPEKFTLERLEQLRQKFGTAVFNSQYQNDTEAMKGQIFRGDWFRYWERPPLGKNGVPWEDCACWIGCDPAATKKDVLLTATKADTDWWTFAVAYRQVLEGGGLGPDFFFRYAWRGRVSKAAYVKELERAVARFRPRHVAVESVAAQEHLAQDLEAKMAVRRVERSTDKVSRAYGLQPFFENRQIVFPSPEVQDRCGGREVWLALEEELLMFPSHDHDDLFDAVETAVQTSLTGRILVDSA